MPSAPYLSRPVPGPVRAVLPALVLCAALYAVLLVGGGRVVGIDPGSWWPVGAFALVAAVICGARAAVQREERLVWTLLGLGMASSGSAFLVWAALYEAHPAPPYPSVSDALWIPYYLLLLSGHASGLGGSENGGAPVAELIQKPFTSTELLARVRGVLGERALSAR